MLTVSELMHIDAANEITVSREPTGATDPISPPGLVFVPTARTLTRCSSFGASEARDVSLFGLVREGVDILAVFPLSQTLIVVSPTVTVADTVRIANEERANLMFCAEVDDFAGGFVTLITNTALCSFALLVLSSLELFPPARIFLATGLFLCHFAKLFGSLMLQGPDAPACDNQSRTCIGRNGCQVDFTQIDRGVSLTRNMLSLWDLNTHMQLKAIVPDKASRTAVLRQIKGKNKRFVSSPHRQDDTPILFADRLSRPFDWREAFFSPGIFHSHLRMSLAELACGVNVGKESVHHHLHGLAMQCKLPFGGFLQFVTPWPFDMIHPCLFVDLDTEVPDFGRFQLSG